MEGLFTSELSSSSSSPCQHIVRSDAMSAQNAEQPRPQLSVQTLSKCQSRTESKMRRHKEIKRGRVKCGRRGNASQRGYPSRHQAALAFPVSSKFAAVSGHTRMDRDRLDTLILLCFSLSLDRSRKSYTSLFLEWLRLGCSNEPYLLWVNDIIKRVEKRKDVFSTKWLEAKQWDWHKAAFFHWDSHLQPPYKQAPPPVAGLR